ncbi:MAG: hydrophobe/amphiphile efflux-3 (HAE3) family transporter [Methanoregulaceae archaeon]|nr:hydrophobe/amphiphile efflux-3 (HAE3) family transporter [Methanoregulaceae archaeon]
MIEKLFEGIARTINKRPLLVAVLVLAIFSVAVFGMTQLSMESGWKTYLDESSEKGIIYAEYIDNFQPDSTIILIVETSDPLDPSILSYIDDLETDIRQQENIKGTLSIVEVLKSAHGGTLPTSRAEIDQIVGALPSATRELVTPSNSLTLVQVQLEESVSEDVQRSALDNVVSLVESTERPPGVTVEFSGTPAFMQQMEQGLESNMGILIGGAMLLMVLAMGILFAYVRYRFMPVLLVGIGLVTSLGLMGLAGIGLNMAVIGAFPVLIGLGIDYAIQFHARFDEEARRGSLEDAVFTTVTKTGPAVLYAMLATCMGFVAMFVSEIPMIRSFGLVAIIGIFTSYWVSCIGVPTLCLLLKYKPKQPKTEACYAVGTDACDYVMDNQKNGNGKKRSFSYGKLLTDTSIKIAKNPLPLLLVLGCIAVIGFAIDPFIPVQTNENSFVPGDMPAKINIDKVTRIIGSTSTADFYIRGYGTDLETVRWIETFQEYELSHHNELTGAGSIVTTILSYNGGVMPETQAELDEVLSNIPEATREEYLGGSLSGVVKFSTVDLEMTQRNSLKRQMIDDIAFLEPPAGISVAPIGSFDLYTLLLSSLADSKEAMTYLGFIFVFMFLVLVYRHLHAVTPMIPIIFIVGWNAVAMYLLGITYTPLTATLGSMTIGVAAEYTILVMERYAEEKERLHDNLAAIRESVHKIGTAITVSGLATFCGFSALCLSTFPIVSNFGYTTLIAVGFSLIGAIVVMPAVLSVMGRFEKPVSRKEGTIIPSAKEESKTV